MKKSSLTRSAVLGLIGGLVAVGVIHWVTEKRDKNRHSKRKCCETKDEAVNSQLLDEEVLDFEGLAVLEVCDKDCLKEVRKKNRTI